MPLNFLFGVYGQCKNSWRLETCLSLSLFSVPVSTAAHVQGVLPRLLVNIKCLFFFVPYLYSWFCVITWVATWKFSFGPTYQSQTVATDSCPKTSVRNYHYPLHNTEKHSSHLLMFLMMRK